MPQPISFDRRGGVSHPLPKLAVAVGVALMGDNLLYDRSPGISLAAFLGVLALTAMASSRRRGGRPAALASVGILAAGLAPLAVDLGVLPLGFGIAGVALATLAWTGGLAHGWKAAAAWAADLLVAGPGRLVPDLAGDRERLAAVRQGMPNPAAVLGWSLPVALCAVFAALLSAANPVIELWLADIPWQALLPGFDLPRLLLLGALASVAWAFVGVRLRRRFDGAAMPPVPGGILRAARGAGALLDARTTTRCLVLFNLLFALQTVLDGAYLWAGASLPPGLTYASYAHRGAYPLMATALLAGAFTLVAMRPRGPGEVSRAVRALVSLWVLQNVALAVSSMLRLDLYVQAYSLTYPRVAALVWMGLVAAGLALILARILLRRGNGWLVASNAAVLAATLYACAFVNFPALVADYNLERSRAGGSRFDASYALSLGPQALPAVDGYLSGAKGPAPAHLLRQRDGLARAFRDSMVDWRAWTLRGGALLGYLEANPAAPDPNRALARPPAAYGTQP